MLLNKKPSNSFYTVRRGDYVRLWLQRALVHAAEHNVWVESCWGTALGADGRELFRVRPFAPTVALEPGDSDSVRGVRIARIAAERVLDDPDLSIEDALLELARGLKASLRGGSSARRRGGEAATAHRQDAVTGVAE